MPHPGPAVARRRAVTRGGGREAGRHDHAFDVKGGPTPHRPGPARARSGGWGVAGAALAALPLGLLLVLWLDGGAPAGGRAMPNEGQHHVPRGTPVSYGHAPPTSGPHWPQPVPWGVHEDGIPPEQWVHNLEHGGLVVLYNCARPCPELVAQLRQAYATLPRSKWGHVKLLATPYARLRTPLAILAWAWLDELSAFDGARLLGAYTARVDRGPEDLP
jgi:Protein of unknown function (DUF3105)